MSDPASMAELVDAEDSKSSGETLPGSSPGARIETTDEGIVAAAEKSVQTLGAPEYTLGSIKVEIHTEAEGWKVISPNNEPAFISTETRKKCPHGKPIYGDGCDVCWNIEMADYHCRQCNAVSYYPEDFKHVLGCVLYDIPAKRLPNWRKLSPNNPRSK